MERARRGWRGSSTPPPVSGVEEIVALASGPDATRDTFARIETAGRDSLNEMRALLRVLRSNELPEPRAPPTLAELDAILTRTSVPAVAPCASTSTAPSGCCTTSVPHGPRGGGGRRGHGGQRALGPEAVELQVSGSSTAGEGAEEALTAARAAAVAAA